MTAQMPATTSARWRLAIALILGSAAALIMACTVVPPPIMLMVPPSIAGAELAPLFLVAGLAVAALAARPAPPWKGVRRIALALGAATVVLSAWPLVRVPGAVAAAERSMAEGFGGGYAGTAAVVRPAPIRLLDLVRGLPSPPIAIDGDVPFATVDGETLRAEVFRPPGAGPHPIVVCVHGGSWSSGSRDEAASANRLLAAGGFLVVSVEYRFAPRSRFPAQLDDVRTAIAWVKSHASAYDGDPSRIALVGRSAGAQLALLAAYDDDPAIRAAVGFYSPVDFTVGYRNPGRPDPLDARSVFRAYLGGTPDDLPELYRNASPIERTGGPHVPTLLIYGGRDALVYLRYGQELVRRLRAGGTRAALIDVPWAEHAFDAIPHGLGGQLALHHLERFLRMTLAPR